MRISSFFATLAVFLSAACAYAAPESVPAPDGWHAPSLADMAAANFETTCEDARTEEKPYLLVIDDFDGDGVTDYARILKNNATALKGDETEYALFISSFSHNQWQHQHLILDDFAAGDDIRYPACLGIRAARTSTSPAPQNLPGILLWQLGTITLQGGIDPTYIYWDKAKKSFQHTNDANTQAIQ